MPLAAAVGPVVGGELVGAFGWPSIFLANLPVLTLSAVLAVRARRALVAVDRATLPRFDWAGTVLLAATLTSLVLGLEASGTESIALGATCLTLLAPFVWWQRRQRIRSSRSRCSDPCRSRRAPCLWRCTTW